MKSSRLNISLFLTITLFVIAGWVILLNMVCGGECHSSNQPALILSVADYQDANMSAVSQLIHRASVQPFNLISLVLFICAIIHTFFCHHFTALSQKLHDKSIAANPDYVDTFAVEILHLLGEIEVVFGLWVIPLFFSLAYVFGSHGAVEYMDDLHMVEPMFVVVIMALASTTPIIKFAEKILKMIAKAGRESASAWWWVILTIGPLAGSLITEPAAMTICALLLGQKFFRLEPSTKLAYATLGLLFVNISVGGVFTHFAAPPVLMVSGKWGWDSLHMITQFGWKALLGILIANSMYYFVFRKEFERLDIRYRMVKNETDETDKHTIPFWITLVHLLFLAWVVMYSHYPILFISAFLLFLGFYQATQSFQKTLDLRSPVLVGCFLAGLVIHGNLQGWWIDPLLGKTSSGSLLGLSIFLTSFNDNAAITFLASLIPNFDEAKQYAVVAGAVAGGGLTVIANAPNPAGQAILGKFFKYGISALGLLWGALIPTIVMALCFYIF